MTNNLSALASSRENQTILSKAASYGGRLAMWIDGLLNRKGLTRYPLIILSVSWMVYLVGIMAGNLPTDVYGKPVAVDLSTYVTGARLVLDGHTADLYSLPHQEQTQHTILDAVDSDFLDIYIAPPFVAYAYAPMAVLPYALAALLWSLVSAALLAASVRLLWPLVPNLHGFGFSKVLLIVFASAPAVEVFGAGQNSALSLVLMCIALRLIVASRYGTSGVALGLGVFKPQLFVLFPVLFVLVGSVLIVRRGLHDLGGEAKTKISQRTFLSQPAG